MEVTSKRDFFFYLFMNIPMYVAMAVLTWKVAALGLLTTFAANIVYAMLVAIFAFQTSQIYKGNYSPLSHQFSPLMPSV